MQVKASLHLHASEDIKDGKMIGYNIFDLIDQAQKNGFSILGITGHEGCICEARHIEYGKNRGVLVIPGIEHKLSGKHILVLNCDQSIESLQTLEDLIEYKKTHPEIFVIAPHPNYGAIVSLGLGKLKQYRHLFDAVEHSWYYSVFFNPNKQTAVVAKELGLPFIATADMHDLVYFTRDYAVLEVENLATEAVFKAITARNFKNVSQCKSLFEMIWYQIKMLYRKIRFSPKHKK